MEATAPRTTSERQSASRRRHLAEAFPTAEARSEYFRRIGETSAAKRRTLSGADAEALGRATRDLVSGAVAEATAVLRQLSAKYRLGVS